MNDTGWRQAPQRSSTTCLSGPPSPTKSGPPVGWGRMGYLTGLLLVLGLQLLSLPARGEEPVAEAAVTESSEVSPEDLPVIRMLELLQRLELLQDLELLLESGSDAVAEDKS